jgi:hypothetical protein
MQRKTLTNLCVAALVVLAVVAFSSPAIAYPNGISGMSGKNGSTCTMCHSSGTPLPTIAITGPTTVTSGSTSTYTLSNNGTPNSGLDVGASAGTFTAGSTTQVMNGEITHLASLTAAPLSWQFSWTAPTVSTTTTVTMYGASISGGYGGSTGVTTLTITVNPAATAPSITSQPGNQTVTAGQTASFSVTASGTAPLTYQWRKNGTNITGATSASYTTPATTTSDSGSTFSVVVTNSAGSATSNNATLTVNAAATAPSITSQPASQTVTAGQTAMFSVTASGTAPLSYQWRKNGANITGATSSSYTTAATTTADSGSTFSVVVTNSAGSATSNNATLTVNAAATAPAITSQPANQTVTAGQTASFSVSASGTSPMSYQWRKNGTNITGATSNSYTTPGTTTADTGSTFSVVVTNSAGSATSNNATLTVNQASAVAPTITTQPASQTVNAGQTATFSVLATGTSPMSYQWRKNGTNITGATASSYTTPATTTTDTGSTFSVIVSNSAGNVTSNNATLTVNSAPAPSGGGKLMLSTNRLIFYAEGTTAPAPKAVNVTSSTGSKISFTADVYGGSWITVNPLTGTTPGQLTVSAYPTGLTGGTYSCVIKVTANGQSKRIYVVLVVSSGGDDGGSSDDDSMLRPFSFDPGAKNTANATWMDGYGVPVQSKKDPTNQALVLTRNPSAPKTAISGATLKGAAGSQLTQLGFDLRSDSECSTHAPQFVVVTVDEVVHKASCASGSIQQLAVAGWQRVSFDPTNAKQLSPALAPGMAVKTVALVMDHPVGSGMAVLDNINVNGRYITRE